MLKVNLMLGATAVMILATTAASALAGQIHQSPAQQSIAIPYHRLPLGPVPHPHPVTCQDECMSPTGLYRVCRYQNSQIAYRTLIDINRCMN